MREATAATAKNRFRRTNMEMIPTNRAALVTCFRQAIGAKHQEAVASDKALKAALLRKLNLVREVGALIGEARSELGYNEFQAATDFLEPEVLRNYTKFSRMHKKPIVDPAAGMRSMNLALRTSGLLPEVVQSSNGQHPRPYLFVPEKCISDLKNFIELNPPSTWAPDQIESVRAALLELAGMLEYEQESKPNGSHPFPSPPKRARAPAAIR